MLDKCYKAVNSATEQVIATRVRIAQNFKDRSVGLLNRASLDSDEGLLIKPCNSIHTFFMKFSIDVVFMTKSGFIVKIVSNIRPWRMAGAIVTGFMALELPAGKSDSIGLKIGQTIKIT